MNNNSQDTVGCFQIVAYNNVTAVTRFQLIGLDNKVLYESGKYTEWETWICDLSTINIPEGTQFKLKASNAATQDATNDTVLTYIPNLSTIPNSATVYFENYSDDWSNAVLYFRAQVNSPYNPPVIVCSNIRVEEHSKDIIFWDVVTLDGRLLLHTDGGDISLGDLDVEDGIKLKLKAVVMGGEDTFAYAILEYSPEIICTANFDIYGFGRSMMLILYSIDF